MLRRHFILGLALTPLLPAVAAGSSYQVFDLMPDYWRFWERGQGKTLKFQAQLFRQMVIAPYRAAFAVSIEKSLGGFGDDKLIPYLKGVRSLLPAMRQLSDRLTRDLPTYRGDFLLAFPDMAWSGRVYFMPSLYVFDGQTNNIDDSQALFFGLDALALYGYQKLGVLLQHELFHLYHRQVNPAVFSESNGEADPLYRQLWTEGLATFVSMRLNPTATVAEVLLSIPLAEKGDALLAPLARELSGKLDSTDPKDLSDFFDAGSKRTDIPPRSGYFIGLRTAEALGKRFTLIELARLGRSELRTELSRILSTFASGT